MEADNSKTMLTILFDTGSSYNFMDPKDAEQVGCLIKDVTPFVVKVASGSHLMHNQQCHSFPWRIQRYEFSMDVRLLSLGGCDMVHDM